MSLMSYIGSPEPQYGARKYVGNVAAGYDAKRVESPKWAAEQGIIEGIIDRLPNGSLVLDVPVGTGRFVSAYERNNHKWTGIDLSRDMLVEASAKVKNPELAELLTGDVTKLHETMAENSVDLAIMCRLTRWLNPDQRVMALKQLQRVSRKTIVFTARIANHPFAYPVEHIAAALEPEWQIVDSIEAGEPEYRVFVLER